jgi:DUF917 family protein
MSGSRLGRMDELSVHNGCRLLGGGGGGGGSLTKYMADLELHQTYQRRAQARQADARREAEAAAAVAATVPESQGGGRD